MLGTLVQGRVCVGGAGINASKVALAIATKYAVRRRQFEATSDTEEELLLDYGMHQRRLFPLIARTYALHFAQEVVAGQLHDVFSGSSRATSEHTRRELESRAAGTKALGTWHATRTIQECREACGGAGYLAVNRFAALKADTDVFTTFEGDNHVLLQLVAKGLLTDYASEFEDMDQLGMVRFVTDLAVETVDREDLAPTSCSSGSRTCCPAATSGTRTPACSTRRTSWRCCASARSTCSPGSPVGSSAGIDQEMNPGVVFSRVQDHVIAAASAHVERLVLEAFVDKIGRAARRRPEGRARPALRPLRADHDRGRPGLVHGARPAVGQRSKAISREIGSLCRKVRPLAVDLSTRSGCCRPRCCGRRRAVWRSIA